MKTATGNAAEIEICFIGPRLEFRIYADSKITLLQIHDPEELLAAIQELDDIVALLKNGTNGYWKIPRRRR